MRGPIALLLIAAFSGMARGAPPALGIIDTDVRPTATATATATRTQTQSNTATRTSTSTATSTRTSTATNSATSPTKPSENHKSSDLGERAAGARVEFTFGHGSTHVAPKEHDISGASSVPEWMLKAAGLLPPAEEEARGAGVASAQ